MTNLIFELCRNLSRVKTKLLLQLRIAQNLLQTKKPELRRVRHRCHYAPLPALMPAALLPVQCLSATVYCALVPLGAL